MQTILKKITSGYKRSQKGFTLIELSIVITIMGLLIAGGGTAYTQYIKETRLEKTALHTDSVVNAIGTFRSNFGRYPCPASLTDTYTDVTYGRETDCTDFSPVPGTCAGGICTEERADAITFLSGGVAINAKPLVRSGYVPFRVLNLPEEYSYDGQGNKIKYVVTQHLTIDVNFEASTGAIDILDGAGVSVVQPQRSAHFLVISHGTDQAGAYTHAGVKIPCPAGLMETDNCEENRVNANYRLAQASTNNATMFDDTVLYFTLNDNPLWQQSAVDRIDIHQKPSGDIAVVLPVNSSIPILNGAEIPSNNGLIRSAVRAKQNIMTDNVCDNNGGDCFPSSLISGSLNGNPADMTDDIKCPDQANEVIDNIAFKAAGCIPIADVMLKCPAGQRITGFDANGIPKCSSPPPRCPSQNVMVCGTTMTLPQGFNGNIINLTTGFNGLKRFRCDVPTWNLIVNQTSPTDCTCTPATVSGSTNCGTGFSGSRSFTKSFICSSRTWSSPVYGPGQSFAAQCTCVGASETRPVSCPQYFKGSPTETRTFTCASASASAGSWGSFIPDPASPQCTCTPDDEERKLFCDNGLTGRYEQKRFLTCGANSAGWSLWHDVPGDGRADNCKCLHRTDSRPKNCPAGTSGTWYEIRDFTCRSGISGAGVWDANWREDPARTQATKCVPDPIIYCNWTVGGTPQSGQLNAVGPPISSPCTCGDPNGWCTTGGSAPFTNYSSCSCQ